MPGEMDFLERQTFGDVLREMDLEHLRFRFSGGNGLRLSPHTWLFRNKSPQGSVGSVGRRDYRRQILPVRPMKMAAKRISRSNLRRTCFLLNACFPTLPR